jgi:hypothetical protein
MPWPAWIRKQFATIPGGVNNATQESLLYGPYNTILGYLFPASEDFMVVPQYQRPTMGQSIDFTTVFVVESANTQTPIFYLEIKPPSHINDLSKREQADTQMRDCVRTLVTELRIPKLHGVSALGVRLAFYCYDAATHLLEPVAIPRDPVLINDTAPAVRWSVDVLSDEGYEQLVQVATEVKNMAQALGV